MFCEKCGSPISGTPACCPTCGAPLAQKTAPGKQKTKSKWLAFFLMWFCVGDIYLGDWKRFCIKIAIGIPTLLIGTAIMSYIDMFKILTGRLNCDVNGIPLV